MGIKGGLGHKRPRPPSGSVLLGQLHELEPDLAHARVNQIKVPGDTIGYINFASFLIRSAVVDTYQYKLAVAGIHDANQRTKGEVGVCGRQGLGREDLAVGGLSAVEPGPVPTRVA